MPPDRNSRYCPIADYAIIGDMRTAALVATDGAIDWCCWPRFDSAPVFYRLLDADDGGHFSMQPTEPFDAERRYVDGTNVLETRFRTDTGEVVLTDFMPVGDDESAGGEGSRLLRLVEGIRGEVDLEVLIEPTFDWGHATPRVERTDNRVVVTTGDESICVASSLDFEICEPATLTAEYSVGEGDEIWVEVAYGDEASRAPSGGEGVRRLLEQTSSYWREWLDQCRYDGPHADAVARSALVLKLLTYAPTGAIIAAPTTSLPEKLGGVRNWDYRYVWLRDAGLILESLQHLGYHDEAMAFWEWLEDLWRSSEKHQMQNIYRVDGSSELPEKCLEHVQGYKGSRPVRVGNDAAEQLQLDRFGEVLDAGYICQTKMREPHPDLKPVLEYLADQAAERWQEPDRGIWEMRGEPRHLVHSKLMCWVAVDRAIRLYARAWLDGDVDRWRDAREEIREAIETRGYNDEIGAFTQTFDGDELDASSLQIPLVGFLDPDDPRVHSTIDRIQDELVVDGFVKRYRTSDGLPGSEGAFVLCSFWLVSALAECGRRDEARDLFDRLVAQTNDVGLLAEEISCGDVGFLGNFPQGFSHLALIDAAKRLATRG